jgi:hypothetical protein
LWTHRWKTGVWQVMEIAGSSSFASTWHYIWVSPWPCPVSPCLFETIPEVSSLRHPKASCVNPGSIVLWWFILYCQFRLLESKHGDQTYDTINFDYVHRAGRTIVAVPNWISDPRLRIVRLLMLPGFSCATDDGAMILYGRRWIAVGWMVLWYLL